MSTETLAVTQYQTVADLSEGLGRSCTEVKRVQLQLPGFESIGVIQVDASRHLLDMILLSLERALTHQPQHAGPVTIPASLVTWIETLHRGDGITPQSLAHVRAALASLPTSLDTSDLALLDGIQLIVDAHASHLFSRIAVAGGTH